jgi:ABC-2 type transport system permease protein
MSSRSVITWSLSLAFMVYAFMSIFSGISADAELMNEMMAEFPEELLIAFGMDNLDWSTPLGFYGFVFVFCQICLAIQAANYGIALVSVEEREFTADFLLVKPVGRSKIMTSKLLSAFTGLTVTNAVVWISSILFLNIYRGDRIYETKPLFLILASIVLFQLFFLSVGLLISLLAKRVRSVTPLSMALAFGMYVLSAFGGMIGDDKLEVITPFKHFEPNYIISNSAYDVPMVLLSVSVIVVSVVASYLLYLKRNISSAV